MRRPTAAVIGTVTGACLLLGAKLGTKPPADLGNAVAEPPGDQLASASTDPSAPGVSSAVPHPTGPSASATSHAPTLTRSGQPAAPAPTGGSGLRSGTFTGTKITNEYVTMQVTITVVSGKITDARATYTTSSPTSSKITGDAVPKLRQEALTAQSANIATVSGATYTSDAYRKSLQWAIDRAKA